MLEFDLVSKSIAGTAVQEFKDEDFRKDSLRQFKPLLIIGMQILSR